MGLFNNWPYVDEHKLNLDWICRTLNKAVDDLSGLDISFVELKDYVEDYFKNLNISEEVNNKLDELVADGTLERLIGQYVDSYIAETDAKIEDIIIDIQGLRNWLNFNVGDSNRILPTSITNGSVGNPLNPDCVSTEKIPVSYGDNIGVIVHRPNTEGFYYVFGSGMFDGNANPINSTYIDYSLDNTKSNRINTQTNCKAIAFCITESNGVVYNQLRTSDFADGDVEIIITPTNVKKPDVSESNITPLNQVGSQYYITSDMPTIKVMTYNVSQFKCDSSYYIDNQKIRNFRDMLAREWPDFLGTQENTDKIDSAGTKSAGSYIFEAVFQEWYAGNGYNENRVYSHYAHIPGEGGLLDYRNLHSWSRTIRYDNYLIGEKKVLICSTHAAISDSVHDSRSPESIAERLVEYTDMLNWCNGDIDMLDKLSNQRVYAPEHDYAIILMDANCITTEDRNNLIDLCAAKNFQLCNGGKYGWLNTCTDPLGIYPLDQILVSGDVIIKSVKTLMDQYGELHSDHVPLVAELVLR